MSNIISYEERLKNFSWKAAEEELEYKEGNVIKARQFFERIAAIDPGFVDVAERLSTLGA